MTTTNEWDSSSLYDRYRVTLRLRDKICGGMPKNPDLIRSWVEAGTEHSDERTEAQTKEAIEALVDATTEKSWNGFPGDDTGGLFIWSRQIKALFKECASMLRVTVEKRGSKQIFQHGFEIKGAVKDDRVYLGRKDPHGYDEGPIHVQTAQGPRTALKRVDYVLAPELTFEVWVLATHAAETRHVGETELRQMLLFGQENGLGADRSQGRGKFDVVAFERVSTGASTMKEPEAKALKGKKGKPAEAVADAE
jgi:hypothetical protein